MKPIKLTEAMERMIKGRVGLIAREPFFATLALEKLELVEDAKCETTWTDGRRLGFNPEHVLAIETMSDLEAIWAHHVATCALGHPFRRGTRDAKLWNEASDHVVNGYITKAGFSLPEGSLYDPRFDGMYVEQVYHQLKQEQSPQDRGGDDGEQDPDGSGSGGAGAQPEGQGEAQAAEGPSNPATGEVRDATSTEGGSEDQPASQAEVEEQAKDWETAVAQAEQAARGAGKLSGSAERLAKSTQEARVDWREALQRFLKAKSKDDYSRRKLSRHSYTMGFPIPGMDAPRCGPLGFAIDVSGSISASLVNQFVAEIEDARQTVNPERIYVWAFDHGIRRTWVFENGEPVELGRLPGGGGTSFREPILAANELEEPLESMVFLTDLCSSSFADEPTYPVIWATTDRTGAPYGEVIRIY